MKQVKLYVIASCLSLAPNKPGGFQILLSYKGHSKTFTCIDENTTVNRIMIQGILYGLNQLKEACKVTVFSKGTWGAKKLNSKKLYDPGAKLINKDLLLQLQTVIYKKGHVVKFVVSPDSPKELDTYKLNRQVKNRVTPN